MLVIIYLSDRWMGSPNYLLSVFENWLLKFVIYFYEINYTQT